MALALLAALQAAAAAPAPAPAPLVPFSTLVPSDFDLSRIRPVDHSLRRMGCERDDPETIVVCGFRPRGGGYRIEEWERIFAEEPLVAETRLFGQVSGRVFLQQGTMPNGDVSNRVMVGIRLPF